MREFKKRQLKYFENHNWIIGICSGMLAGFIYIGILPVILTPLVLLPVLYLLLLPVKKYKSYVWPILIWFVTFHAFVLSWMLESDVSEASGFTNFSAKLAVVICWLIMITVTTITMMILPTVVYFVRRRWLNTESWSLYMAIASFWVVTEYLRSIVFGAFTYGPGGTVGDFWGFGSLGLAAVNSLLSPLAGVVGLYGLSFLVIGFALGLYQIVTTRRFSFLLTMFGIGLLFGLVSYTQLSIGKPTSNKNLEVSVLSQQDDNNHPSNLLPIQPFRESKKDLIVLPEYSDIYKLGSSNQSINQVDGRLNDDGVSLDVVETIQSSGKYATGIVRDKNGMVVSEQTKQFLIPTGEYMPYVIRWFFEVIGQDKIVAEYDSNQALQKGQPPGVVDFGDNRVGVIACSGILNRQAYRSLSNQGGEALVSNASLTMFNGSKVYFDQSLAMAKFHAVANHRPFIQATKGAPSFVLDASGRYVLEPSVVASQFSDVTVSSSNKQTIYTRYGELVLYTLVTFSLFVIVYCVLRSTGKKKQIKKPTKATRSK
jgi:apolipoprotein N-acyltransferase